MTVETPAMLRLRSAGVGVVVGGITLAVLGAGLSFPLAAGVLLGIAVVGAIASHDRESWLVQLFVGIGALGAIGFIEATTAAGLGIGPQQLGGAAVVFGFVDIVAGSLIHRFQGQPDG
jgi:hypothetical protein